MFYISDQIEKIQMDAVKALLKQTYWAQNRSEELIRTSIQNSVCYGAYLEETGKQIGFARVVTDYASVYYICDVIVDEQYRRMGLGKELIRAIVSDERFISCRGILATADAHGLYEKYGFKTDTKRFMGKAPCK